MGKAPTILPPPAQPRGNSTQFLYVKNLCSFKDPHQEKLDIKQLKNLGRGRSVPLDLKKIRKRWHDEKKLGIENYNKKSLLNFSFDWFKTMFSRCSFSTFFKWNFFCGFWGGGWRNCDWIFFFLWSDGVVLIEWQGTLTLHFIAD